MKRVDVSMLPKAPGRELSRRRRFLVLAVCCVSVIVVVMDIAVVNVALPTVRRDLHASESGLQWTVDAYTLVLAGFLVLAGSTADRVGRRRVFQIGLAMFGLGSLWCGVAPSVGWLIAARVLQAVGGTLPTRIAETPSPPQTTLRTDTHTLLGASSKCRNRQVCPTDQ